MKKDLRNMEMLSAYLDDELSAQEKAEVEKLLANSLEMKKKLEDLKKTKEIGIIPEKKFFGIVVSKKKYTYFGQEVIGLSAGYVEIDGVMYLKPRVLITQSNGQYESIRFDTYAEAEKVYQSLVDNSDFVQIKN